MQAIFACRFVAPRSETAGHRRISPRRASASVCAGLVRVAAALVACQLACSALAQTASKPAKKAGAESAPASEHRAALEAAGLKLSGSTMTLADEAVLSKQLADATKQKKALVDAEHEAQAVEEEIDNAKKEIIELKTKDVELSAQLAGVSSAVENNQLVGALNAIRGQIDLLIERQKTLAGQLKTAQSKSSDLREAFIETVLGMHVLADSITQQWSKLAADSALQKAVEAENSATGSKLKLAPSAGFLATEKRLQTLENTVLSESIPLDTDQGGLWVDVNIDGKRKKMVVDSGSSLISLPLAMAKELGLEPTSQNQQITVSLADGSEIPATLMNIPSVRVGKFTLENVDCCVLDQRATNAPPLLGMSFLGKFKFELNKEKAELKMVKFDSGEKPKAGAAKNSSAKTKKKK
jgi:aspartyl protease family protein